jgi:hypothetical protein
LLLFLVLFLRILRVHVGKDVVKNTLIVAHGWQWLVLAICFGLCS